MTNERLDFERWMRDEAKCVVGSSDPYPAGLERMYWQCWQAARRSIEPPAPLEIFKRFAVGTLFQLKESGNLAVLTPDGKQDVVALSHGSSRLLELARAVYDEALPESCELLRLVTEMFDESAENRT
jgi:hypothetical protein